MKHLISIGLWALLAMALAQPLSAQVTLMEKNFDFQVQQKKSSEGSAQNDTIQKTTYTFEFKARRAEDKKFEFFLHLRSKVVSGTGAVKEYKDSATEDDTTKSKFTLETLDDGYNGFSEKLASLFVLNKIDSCMDIGSDQVPIAKHSAFQDLAKKLFYQVAVYAAVQDSKTNIAGWVKVQKRIPMFDKKAIGFNRKALDDLWEKERARILEIKKEDNLLEDQDKDKIGAPSETIARGSETETGIKYRSIKWSDLESVVVEYIPKGEFEYKKFSKSGEYADKVTEWKIKTPEETEVVAHQDTFERNDSIFIILYSMEQPKKGPTEGNSIPILKETLKISSDNSISKWELPFNCFITKLTFHYKDEPWIKREKVFEAFEFFDFESDGNNYNGEVFTRCIPERYYGNVNDVEFQGATGTYKNKKVFEVSKDTFSFQKLFITQIVEQGTYYDPFDLTASYSSPEIDTTRWIIGSETTIKQYKKLLEGPAPKTLAASSPKPEYTPISWTKNGKDTLLQGKYIRMSTEGDRLTELKQGNKDLLDKAKGNNPFLVQKRETAVEPIQVNSVQFEFRNGLLENVVVLAKEVDGLKRDLKFTTGLPIGISSQKNIDYLDKYWLYEDNFDEYVIRLSDLIEYTQNLNLASKDYSPADQTITLKPHERTPLIKEMTAELFEAKVFTDFVGLNTESPNGLVQTEVSKRINLYTRRLPIFRWDPRKMNISYGAYIEPMVTVSKFEENNRYLRPGYNNRLVNGQISKDAFVSTMALLNFENFAAGIDLNLFLIDFQQIKTEIMIDGGFRFGRTAIEDSVFTLNDQNRIISEGEPARYGVNTFRYYLKGSAQIFPDSRYGLRLAYQQNIAWLLDNRLTQVANVEVYARSQDVGRPACGNRFEMMAHFQPSKAGRFFFRYSFNSQWGNWKTNFHQAQVGYSFFLTTQKIEKNVKDQ